MSLARRAEPIACKTPLTKIWEVIGDVWHPTQNPSGYVSLGVAENTLMHDRNTEKLPLPEDVGSHDFTYGDGPSGSFRMKRALAAFLNRKHSPTTPLLPEHIAVTNGCSAAIEQLSWVLANPDDVWLLGQPYYGTFVPDLGLRAMTTVCPVAFGKIDAFSMDAVAVYEAAILANQAQGKRVAAIMLCNPHNPLGRCFSKDTLIGMMKLCTKYGVHLVSDELYAFSIWENRVDTESTPVGFTSALSIPNDDEIDPSLVHVLWGMSKDFGANGIRVGVLIDQHNEALRLALNATSLYTSVSVLPSIMVCKIFEDNEWVDNYLAENSRKLAARFEIVAHWAKDAGIEYTKGANAGFFIWAKLSDVYLKHHPESNGSDNVTDEISERLLGNRVFLASGSNFGAEEAGWFRIIFAVDEVVLREGLRRIEVTLRGEKA